jgi:hypothetical protein
MTDIKTIMACIDLSDYSLMTLGYALGLAQQEDIKVTICSVVPLREATPVFLTGTIYHCREDHTRSRKNTHCYGGGGFFSLVPGYPGQGRVAGKD